MRGTLTLLDEVNLVLHKGHRIGIIGRNGCGKTSLLKALAGEISLENGEIAEGNVWNFTTKDNQLDPVHYSLTYHHHETEFPAYVNILFQVTNDMGIGQPGLITDNFSAIGT